MTRDTLSSWETSDVEADDMPAPPRILDQILQDIQPAAPPPEPPPPAPVIVPPRARPHFSPAPSAPPAETLAYTPPATEPRTEAEGPRRSGLLVAGLLIVLTLNLALAVVIIVNLYREQGDETVLPAPMPAAPAPSAPAPALTPDDTATGTPDPLALIDDILATIEEPPDRPTSEPPPSQPAIDRPLTISKLVLCRHVGGFGNYDPIPDTNIRPRHIPYIQAYVEIAHPKPEPRDDGRHVYYMTQHTKLYRADVGPTQPLMDTSVSLVTGGMSPRQDFHASQHLQTPRTVPPGRYTLLVRVTDQISGESAVEETSFVVHPE